VPARTPPDALGLGIGTPFIAHPGLDSSFREADVPVPVSQPVQDIGQEVHDAMGNEAFYSGVKLVMKCAEHRMSEEPIR